MAYRPPARAARALRVARLRLPALVALAAAIMCWSAPVAGAGSLGKARQTVEALRSLSLRQAIAVHAAALAYQTAQAKVALLEPETSASVGRLRDVMSRYRQTETLLQQEAVSSYATPGWGQALAAAQQDSFTSIEARSTYANVALGDLSQVLKQFHGDTLALSAATADYRHRLAVELVALRRAASARRAAVATASRLQDMLDRAQTRLSELAAASAAKAGPPVGQGIVKAVRAELGSVLGPPTNTAVTAKAVGSPAAAPRASATSRPVTSGPLVLRTTETSRPSTTTTARRASSTTAALVRAPRPGGQPPSSTSTTAGTSPPPSATTTPATTTPATTTSTTTTTATTITAAPPTTAPSTSGERPVPAGGVWLELRECESGNNYEADTGNGFYGAYQFALSTWVDLGYQGRPDQASYWVQDQAAQRLQAQDGWAPWPACSAALGL